jgi:hypothetical protein
MPVLPDRPPDEADNPNAPPPIQLRGSAMCQASKSLHNIDCQEASSKTTSQKRANEGCSNASEAFQREIRNVFAEEYGTHCVRGVRICDYNNTEPRKLTVGLVLALFLVVTAGEIAQGRPVPAANKQAEMIMAEVYSFSNPPLNFRKEPTEYRRLPSWMQKQHWLAARGDHQGHQD